MIPEGEGRNFTWGVEEVEMMPGGGGEIMQGKGRQIPGEEREEGEIVPGGEKRDIFSLLY